MWSHVGVAFYHKAAHWRDVPGGTLWYELFVLLYIYILPSLHPTESVLLLLVDVQPCLVVGWICGEVCLEGWEDTYSDSIFTDKGGKGRDNWWYFLGEKGAYLPDWYDGVFFYHPDQFLKSWMFFPQSSFVLERWSNPRSSRLMMVSYLSCICDTHHPCCMIIYSRLTARRRCPRNLVMVEWVEEEGLIVIPVVEVSGALWWHIVVVLNMLVIPPVPLRMCRVVVWSRPCLL